MIDFIKILRAKLPRFSKVLELESKKGEDLKKLHEYFEVVASERSKTKTRYLKDEFIDIRVIMLDNLLLDTHKRFDCIFSRNSLESLSLLQFSKSLQNQKNILNKDGLILHIMNSSQIQKNEILTLVNEDFEILETNEIKDSFYFLAKKC